MEMGERATLHGKKQHLDLSDKVLAKETVHEPNETL